MRLICTPHAILCTILTLYTHLTVSCLPGTTQCLFSSTVLALLPAGTLDMCAYLEFAEKHLPLLYTDHFMTRGGKIPSLLLTMTCLPTIPYPQGAFSPTHFIPVPPGLPTDASKPGGFPYCPAPTILWSGAQPTLPCVAFGHRLKGVQGSRAREALAPC